jgi:hypothetical protein
MTLNQAESVARARYLRSKRTRRDWVLYVHDVEALRSMAGGTPAL